MKLKKTRTWQTSYKKPAFIAVCVFVAFGFLMYYKLGSLTHGLSKQEVEASVAAVGWHGVYHSPLYFPLKALRSIDFRIFRHHGYFLTRFPNTIFGFLSAICFSALIYLWHGQRTAILSTLLFCCSAWVLHASRLASYDVLYLFGITVLLLTHQLFYKYEDSLGVWLINLFIWGLLITIPGFIWIVLVDAVFQRELIAEAWKNFNLWWHRVLGIILPILYMPVIAIHFRHLNAIKDWLGIPLKLADPLHLIRQFFAVFYHLFVRGPLYPSLWLGRSPTLDAFVLALCILGIYFYASRYKSSRSRLLGILFIISVILVALNGPVSFLLLIPFMYVAAAMGLSYLIHEWLKVFPRNPLARYFGIGLITLAVLFSCVYNLRSYFIAWPNNPVTVSIFSHRI